MTTKEVERIEEEIKILEKQKRIIARDIYYRRKQIQNYRYRQKKEVR